MSRDFRHTDVVPARHGCDVVWFGVGNAAMKCIAWAAFLCLLVASPGLAQQHPGESLARPDPGIGEGFASAMAAQFEEAFGVNAAQANCLVYEVMADLHATKAYDRTPTQIAEKVGGRCGLTLKAVRP
jgi:hypothetical protein